LFFFSLTCHVVAIDLFIVTYPKCGTTWTQHITYLILHDGIPLAPDQRMDVVWPHLEEMGKDFVREKATIAGGYRLIKTHFPYKLTPQNPNAKYIYVARNPKDCVVSFYHHTGENTAILVMNMYLLPQSFLIINIVQLAFHDIMILPKANLTLIFICFWKAKLIAMTTSIFSGSG
jgi:hypothetical protein